MNNEDEEDAEEDDDCCTIDGDGIFRPLLPPRPAPLNSSFPFLDWLAGADFIVAFALFGCVIVVSSS